MTCKSAALLIEPYLDGELDAAQKAEMERHLLECESCAAVERRLCNLRDDLRTLPRYDASEQLRARVLSSLRQPPAVKQMPVRRTTWQPAGLWAIAATALLALSIGWNLILLRSQKGADHAETEIAHEIVSSHVRSLIGNHLLDVPSTDQHNVKPWFNGKIDYAPDVKDFAPEGFPLIGGRVDYVDHRSIAALVYKRREHVINLFVLPAAEQFATPESSNGFHLVSWSTAGVNYCAVSDLTEAELRQFADLYRR